MSPKGACGSASSFTLRKNAKHAAEAMIRKGTAPAVDYGIEPSDNGRFEIDWAISTGNQGVTFMLVAERLGDPTKAQTAVQQIEVALAIMGEGGSASTAAYYEAQLLQARALFDYLTSR